MSKTLVIGANGQIGKQLMKLMCDANLPVKAMVRHQEQVAYFEAMGAEVILADLESSLPDSAFSDCDKVVFAAGSGPKTGADKTILIDLWGAVKSVDMAKKHKIKQFVMLSARDAGDPENGTPAIKHYNVCKYYADKHLLESDVPFTILRPGKLTDDKPTGQITTQRPDNENDHVITRADVALSLLHCLTHPSTINHIDELYQGSTDIADALN